MDYEISFNPFSDRRNQITKWKEIAKIDIDASEGIVKKANEIMEKKIKQKDSFDLFGNPVGCLTSLAVFQAKALQNCGF
jgi:hypothetical protein